MVEKPGIKSGTFKRYLFFSLFAFLLLSITCNMNVFSTSIARLNVSSSPRAIQDEIMISFPDLAWELARERYINKTLVDGKTDFFLLWPIYAQDGEIKIDDHAWLSAQLYMLMVGLKIQPKIFDLVSREDLVQKIVDLYYVEKGKFSGFIDSEKSDDSWPGYWDSLTAAYLIHVLGLRSDFEARGVDFNKMFNIYYDDLIKNPYEFYPRLQDILYALLFASWYNMTDKITNKQELIKYVTDCIWTRSNGQKTFAERANDNTVIGYFAGYICLKLLGVLDIDGEHHWIIENLAAEVEPRKDEKSFHLDFEDYLILELEDKWDVMPVDDYDYREYVRQRGFEFFAAVVNPLFLDASTLRFIYENVTFLETRNISDSKYMYFIQARSMCYLDAMFFVEVVTFDYMKDGMIDRCLTSEGYIEVPRQYWDEEYMDFLLNVSYEYHLNKMYDWEELPRVEKDPGTLPWWVIIWTGGFVFTIVVIFSKKRGWI